MNKKLMVGAAVLVMMTSPASAYAAEPYAKAASAELDVISLFAVR